MKEVTWNFCILQWQLSEAYKKNMFVFAIETGRKVSTREKKITPSFPSSNDHGFVGLFSYHSRERRIPFKTS